MLTARQSTAAEGGVDADESMELKRFGGKNEGSPNQKALIPIVTNLDYQSLLKGNLIQYLENQREIRMGRAGIRVEEQEQQEMVSG